MLILTNMNLNQNELQNAVLQPLATAPASPKFGQIYTNSASNKIMWYDGGAWRAIGVVIEQSDTNGNIKVDNAEIIVYRLPVATDTTLGGIKVGEGLTITAEGVLSAVLKELDWANITNKPTKLSEFTNDEGFVDSTVENLANYYTKNQTYTQAQVNDLIGQLATISITIVDALPSTGKSNIIYLVPKANGSGTNVYTEYLWTGTKFESIGDTSVDLTNYLTVTGDASNTTAAFDTAASRTALATGDSMAVLFGKIAKYFADIKTVAYTGSYNDLTNTPNLLQTASKSIAAGQISTSFTGINQIVSVYAYDNNTGEEVGVDTMYSNYTLTVSISKAHSHEIIIKVAYYS